MVPQRRKRISCTYWLMTTLRHLWRWHQLSGPTAGCHKIVPDETPGADMIGHPKDSTTQPLGPSALSIFIPTSFALTLPLRLG
jgi:hypothetical protein